MVELKELLPLIGQLNGMYTRVKPLLSSYLSRTTSQWLPLCKELIVILEMSNSAHSLNWYQVTLFWSHQSISCSVSCSVSQLAIRKFRYIKDFYNYFSFESISGQIWKLINMPHHRLGKLRLVFGWCYFVGFAYSFVIPTMNH